MPSTTTTPAKTITDEALVEQLTTALSAAQVELAEIDPRRDALVARIAQLEATIAVFRGETPPAPKRRASKRRAKRAAAVETPAADAS